jgi:K+-sensing histidine kinase KdpD
MEQDFNTRILVIDDDENVRSSFREILQPSEGIRKETDELQRLGASLFGDEEKSVPGVSKRSTATFEFEYSDAPNGKQGYEMIKKALENNKPYAAVFVDMRMPGWDGLETVQHLRQIDKRAEVVFVTAYTDHSIEEIVTAVGTNVSYHCKPFSVDEIEQIATKAVYEWNKTRSLEELIKSISKLRGQHWDMDTLLENILQQVSYLLGTHSALIAMKRNSHYEKILATGNLCEKDISDEYLSHIPENLKDEVFQDDECAYFKVEEFGILAMFEKGGKPLNNEKLYIVRLFLEQAAQAIHNVDLQEALIRKEKLSAVGEATSMIVHDLKNSIGSIELAIETIEIDLDDREFVVNMLAAVRDSAREGMAYMKDILDFTGNKKAERTMFDFRDLLVLIDKRISPILKKSNVNLKVDCPEDFVFAVDENKLYRAVSNLIKNAEESFAGKNINSPEVCLSLNHDEKNIYIKVSDNGPGIPENIAENIFTPFVSSGKATGTGLGLAIVKQIVEAHDGEITLATSLSGTTFNIIIPVEK